jgi:signal transduction histidine kinase
MINSALAFVKESERAPDRRRLHLLSLVESVVDDLGPKAAAVTVRIGADPVVEGDALALGRLVANLLDNALKYAGAARCVVSEDVGFARFEVEDDGPGVAPDEIEGLFEPFVRGAVQRATAVDGLGLGLSIVRTIAEAHGGYARIANRPSGGLTAAVRLPLAPIAG